MVEGAPAPAELVAERTGFVRRLWKDCFTSVNDALRTSLANRENATMVQLMPAERHARMEEQKDRLDVLEWDDHTLRVGPNVLDKCIDMIEKEKMRHIPWAEYTTEEQESDGVKLDPIWKMDKDGRLAVTQPPDACHNQVSDDATMSLTLQRRSLAFDLARLCDYKLMQRWTTLLTTAFRKKPMVGYAAVSMDQIHQADKDIFRWMARQTAGGLLPDVDERPFETKLNRVLRGKVSEITNLLNNLPSNHGSGGVVTGEAFWGAARTTEKRRPEQNASEYSSREEKLLRTIESFKGQVNNLKKAKGQGKGKGGSQPWNRWTKEEYAPPPPPPGGKGRDRDRGTNNGQWERDRMPRGLEGCVSKFEKKRLCFDYNLPGGCKHAYPGQECRDGGWHLCCAKWCGSHKHNYQTHGHSRN